MARMLSNKINQPVGPATAFFIMNCPSSGESGCLRPALCQAHSAAHSQGRCRWCHGIGRQIGADEIGTSGTNVAHSAHSHSLILLIVAARIAATRSLGAQPAQLPGPLPKSRSTLMEGASKQKKLCPHQRQRSRCKDCGGSSICEHQRIRRECRECGGSAFCEHQRIRSRCKDCDGGAICEHQRRRSECKDCGGGAFCEHQRIRSRCKECKKQAEEASAQDGRPRDAGGKRGARDAGLGEGGAAKKPRPT